ncbi:MAG TPA: hypothetical protein VF607_11870 [Verrucomicrobiae bacterium]
MKTTFDFHSCLAVNGENLPLSVNFLPGHCGVLAAGKHNFALKTSYMPGFFGFFHFLMENQTMAQPMLKEIRNEMR